MEFEARFEDLGNKSAAMSNTYRVASPDPAAPAKVPILVHSGKTMIESALVARYVAGAFQVRESRAEQSTIGRRERRERSPTPLPHLSWEQMTTLSCVTLLGEITTSVY